MDEAEDRPRCRRWFHGGHHRPGARAESRENRSRKLKPISLSCCPGFTHGGVASAAAALAPGVQLPSLVKPPILLVSPWLRDGGIERELQVKGPWLAAAGHPVEVASWFVTERLAGAPNPVLETFRAHGIRVRRLSAHGRLQHVQRAARLAVMAWRRGYPVVVGHELMGNLVALMAKVMLGGRLRVVAELHNSSDMYSESATSPRLLRLARRLYPHADSVRAVSENVRYDCAQFLGLDPDRISTIFNPFPLDHIRAQAVEATAPGLDELGSFIIGCGRFVRMKGFPDLIRGFARARRRAPRPVKLVILGDGPDRAALLRCAEKEGIAGDVVMPGFVANPVQYFARARAFVLSSRFGESFSRVLVEAMTCGVPVISSRCGGPEEVLGRGAYGLLYPVGDVDALADAILRLLEDQQMASLLAKRALGRVEEFSEERVLPQLRRCYVA